MKSKIINEYIKQVKLTRSQEKQLAVIQTNISNDVHPPADPDYWHKMLDAFWERINNQS